jgi:DNA modification methylase
MPWRVAFALQDDGWWLRQDIIWSKPNPMPESVTDRCTKAHEYLFLLSKSARYHFDQNAIAEPANWPGGSWGRSKCYDDDRTGKLRSFYGNGAQWQGGETRNRRSVWEIATTPLSEAHFATFPPALVEPCILAGCPVGGTVLDPFFGAGTTGLVADRLGRNCVGIELNPAYAAMARRRIEDDAGLFAEVA